MASRFHLLNLAANNDAADGTKLIGPPLMGHLPEWDSDQGTASPSKLERVFATLDSVDIGDMEAHNLERLRRSIVMLSRGQPGLDRDSAVTLIEELQRLQVSARRYRELVGQLRALFDQLDDAARPSG